MQIKINNCPYCNGTEFVIGNQNGYATISGESLFSDERVFHVICRTCGSIVRSYVNNPEKLVKRKDRK